MNALSIVLICVVSVFILVIISIIFIKNYMRRFFADEREDFKVLDKYAREHSIVLLGDSLTDFFPINEFANGLNIINRGIATERIEDVENRIDEVVNLKPSKVFLQIGINNLINQGKKADYNILAERIIKLADSFNKDITTVYIISLYPVNLKKMKFGVSKFICNHANNQRVIALNSILQKKCVENEYSFINLYPLLIDENGNLKKNFTIEGLHLSVKCYDLIYNEIKKYF